MQETFPGIAFSSQLQCIRGNCHLEDMGLYEPKQPLQHKEPHILLQPLHASTWQAPYFCPYDGEGKKKNNPFDFQVHRIQDGYRLYKELTHKGKKACKREQKLPRAHARDTAAFSESMAFPIFYQACPDASCNFSRAEEHL